MFQERSKRTKWLASIAALSDDSELELEPVGLLTLPPCANRMQLKAIECRTLVYRPRVRPKREPKGTKRPYGLAQNI